MEPLEKAFSAISNAANAVWSVAGIRTEEHPRHDVVGRIGVVEIRRYAKRLAAQTTVTGGEETARSTGFNRLAGYIFGGNKGENRIEIISPATQAPTRIAMTSPVAQEKTAEGWRIRFFLPARLTIANAPEPIDPLVTIIELPKETYAVLRFTGSTGAIAVAEQTETLAAVVRGSDWSATGQPVAWFYDPPWTLPPLRRNEVAIPVLSPGALPSAS